MHTLRRPSPVKADIQKMATGRMDAQNKEDAATMYAEDAVFSPPELTVSDRTAIETGLKKDCAAAASSKMSAMTLDPAGLDGSAGSWRQICNVLTIKLHGWYDVRRASTARWWVSARATKEGRTDHARIGSCSCRHRVDTWRCQGGGFCLDES